MERRRRRYSPVLERIEGRELCSGVISSMAGQPSAPAVNAGLLQARAAANGTGASASGGSLSGGIGGIGSGGPPLIGQGQPTPQELRRDTFRASFIGPVVVGPGRFTDQAKLVYVRGLGTTSFFHHGDMNLGFVIPTDPAAAPSGVVVMQDKNINSGGFVGLDLTEVPNAPRPNGLPAHFTFLSDPNIYSGIFFVDSSTGTVDIAYHGRTATVTITGLIYTSGLTNPLKNSPLYEAGGRRIFHN